jgi:uncharacterized protein with beta-barrel porin domain
MKNTNGRLEERLRANLELFGANGGFKATDKRGKFGFLKFCSIGQPFIATKFLVAAKIHFSRVPTIEELRAVGERFRQQQGAVITITANVPQQRHRVVFDGSPLKLSGVRRLWVNGKSRQVGNITLKKGDVLEWE